MTAVPPAVTSALAVSLVMAAATGWRIWRHPRRPSNGFWILATVVSLWYFTVVVSATVLPSDGLPVAVLIGVAPFLLVPPLVTVTGLALLANTGVVIRREGLRPATLAPAVIGAALLVTVVAVVVAVGVASGVVASSSRWLLDTAVIVLIPGAMLIVELSAYTVYAVIYRRLPRTRASDAVVILGCGLIGDRVSPLLAGRVDRGIAEYRAQRALGADPLLVMSGGRGGDESVSEAEAMVAYAGEQGIDAGDILIENRSTSTEENLRFTAELLKDGRVPDPVLTVVTSDFHVLRTASLTRQLHLDASVTGSRTPRYYLPSAFLREFAALVVHYRRSNLVVWMSLSLLWLLPLLLS